MDWPLAEAKNRFSEVVTLALTEGPQRIRRRDQAVILVSEFEYQRLIGERPSFKEFLFNGPGIHDLDLSRDDSPMRDIAT
ncbi:type II toxin-antitoxin system Phd/YefM family antitoxin [bacterium]|nr:type II toxin-antitoxin system Phd/YefM family antitoxin [bacterium]